MREQPPDRDGRTDAKDGPTPGDAVRALDATSIVTRLIAELDVAAGFPEAAEAEARAWLADDGIDDASLVDLTALPFVTVDDDGSRDLDQALHVEQGVDSRPGGGSGTSFRIRYALADAAWYVRPGDAAWIEALERGATLYAPDRSLPMLPRTLSEGLVSLGPGVARRALVFDMRVDDEGVVRGTELLRARVRSRLQLTYPGVQRVVDGEIALEAARANQPASLATPVDPAERDALHASLGALRAVGERLAEAQRRRGVIEYDRTESDVRIEGGRFDVTPRRRLDSERWNEQLSLACNTEGAALLVAFEAADASLEPVFRVHDAPGSARRRELDATLGELISALGLDGPWRRDSNTSLADWFAALPDDAPRLKRALQRQILRAQRASRYEGAPGRHHALAAAAYARFSSPMREIVGIHTHRVCLGALDSSGTLDAEDATATLRSTVTADAAEAADAARSSTLRDAVIASAEAAKSRQKTLERGVLFEVIAALFARDLESKSAAWRTGTLLGIDDAKLHVGLDDMALDVKLYRDDLDALTATTWTFDRVRASSIDGRLPPLHLGDGVRVRAVRFDAERARFVLEIERLETARPPRRRRERAGGKRAARRRRGQGRSGTS